MLNEKITDKTPMLEILENVDPTIIVDDSELDPHKQAQHLLKEMFDMQMVYRSAIREISTKLEILNDEFQSLHERNPIHTMSSRVKSPKSIVEKLGRKGYPISVDSAVENLNDIAGVRVVCPYIEDIYAVSQLLKSQDDLEVLRTTDYIKNPKPSGYRSLHIVVKVPIFLSDHKQPVKVEVQIRTIAMDFWASLEHQLRYKSASKVVPEVTAAALKECADTIAETDRKMQDIHNQVIR